MKRLIYFSIIFLISTNLFSQVYLLNGVDFQNQTGFYDSNKLFDGKDDDLCWAFSASNQLQYWQDRQNQDYINFKNIPNGRNILDNPYQSDITYDFVKFWDNDGGQEINGFNWWLKDVSSTSIYPEGGGYWSEFFANDSFIGEEVDLLEVSQNTFFDTMDFALKSNYGMTLGIYTEYGAHAITLWGYEKDNDLNYVYLTDSDDCQTVLLKEQIYFDVTSNLWTFDENSTYKDWHIEDMTYFSAVIPEPFSYAMIIGWITLGFVYYRTRK